MADRKLIDYIADNLHRGYHIGAIRQHLIAYGYKTRDVDDAINSIYGKKEVKHIIHLSKSTVFILVLFFLLFIFAGFYFFLRPEGKALLDVQLEGIATTVKPGDELSFIVELINMGSKKRFDVALTHELISNRDRRIIVSKDETRALETTASLKTNLKIPPKTETGEYSLRTTARYQGEKAIATLPIRIFLESAKPTCSDGIQNQDEQGIDCGGSCESCRECPSCDDGNKCTKESCSSETSYECVYEIIAPCCGNGRCEQNEDYNNCNLDCERPRLEKKEDPIAFVDQIKEIAKEDEAKASQLCSTIEEETYHNRCLADLAEATGRQSYCEAITADSTKDKCYISVADATKNKAVCERISKESRRDSCYMTFVMKEDYSVCDRLVNEYLRQSCESLRQLKESA